MTTKFPHAKIARLENQKKAFELYIVDLEKENNSIYEKLKDMSTVSANKADELQNRVIYNRGEIENALKEIEKFNKRILQLAKFNR